MTPEERDDRIDASLRRGLRALVAPEPSPGFDEAVLSAMRRGPEARQVWSAARPAMVSGALSLAATLLLLQWALRPPALVVAPMASSPVAADVLDRAIASGDLRGGSLAAMLRGSATPRAPRSEPVEPRQPAPGEPDSSHSQSNAVGRAIG